jgi:tetratricopeptide (TPR) repeat protein
MDFRQFRAVIASARKALSGYRTLHDSRRIVVAGYYIAVALTFLDRLAEAKALLEEILPVAWEAKSPDCGILRALAMAAYLNGDPDSGRKRLTEALQISEALGSGLGVFHTLDELAECEFCAGNPELALKYAKDALAVLRGLPSARTRSVPTLCNISRYLVELARFDDAEEHALESLAIALESQQDILVAWNLENLAAITGLRRGAAPKPLSVSYERAARILGFVNARLEVLEAKRDPTSRPQYERVLAVMNTSLGSDAVASLMAEGARLSEEHAIDLATLAPA